MVPTVVVQIGDYTSTHADPTAATISSSATSTTIVNICDTINFQIADELVRKRETDPDREEGGGVLGRYFEGEVKRDDAISGKKFFQRGPDVVGDEGQDGGGGEWGHILGRILGLYVFFN